MRLQKAPSGLLGAFQLKVEGQNPNEFSDTVVPIVDVMDMYLADVTELVPAAATIATGTTSNTVTHTVPNGEMWRVLAYGWDGVLGAGDGALTSLFGAAILSQGLLDSVQIAPISLVTGGGANGRARSYGNVMPRPVLLPSGWGVAGSVQLSAVTTANFTFSFDLMIQRIRE